jgi:hypothetical protein
MFEQHLRRAELTSDSRRVRGCLTINGSRGKVGATTYEEFGDGVALVR